MKPKTETIDEVCKKLQDAFSESSNQIVGAVVIGFGDSGAQMFRTGFVNPYILIGHFEHFKADVLREISEPDTEPSEELQSNPIH